MPRLRSQMRTFLVVLVASISAVLFGCKSDRDRCRSIEQTNPKADEWPIAACDRACEAGDGVSCRHAGNHANDIAHDGDKARKRYERACSLGDLEGCQGQGHCLSHGIGGAVDLAGAKLAMKKACDGGFEIGCRDLGRLNAPSASASAK